jgi:hypothetical protein
MHASSGNRIHDPSVRVGEDGSCLRKRGHSDRPLCLHFTHFTQSADKTLTSGLMREYKTAKKCIRKRRKPELKF